MTETIPALWVNHMPLPFQGLELGAQRQGAQNPRNESMSVMNVSYHSTLKPSPATRHLRDAVGRGGPWTNIL